MSSPIPIYTTPLFGRAEVMSLAHAMLEHHRWLTLVGPGGIGKTRIAAALGQDFSLVAFVDASLCQTSREVGEALELALDLDVGAANNEPTLGRRLDEFDLVVLDNLEQIPDARDVLERLLAASQRVRFVCTSRSRLASSLEQSLAVAPLSVDSASHEGSVALFIDRARLRRHDWEPGDDERTLIAHLCSLLDGLPLAIELVAARSHAVPVRSMIERLEGLRSLPTRDPHRIERHTDLEAVIDWSVRLLSVRERTALSALASLASGFRLEFAIAFLERLGIKSTTLFGLIQHALVVDQGGRHVVLHLVRLYARAHLKRLTDFENAYRDAVGDLIRFAVPEPLRGAVTDKDMQRFNTVMSDWPHIQATMSSALAVGNFELPWLVLDRLALPLVYTGRAGALPEWFHHTLSLPGIDDAQRLRLLTLYSIALVELDDSRLVPVNQSGLDLATRLGDERRILSFTINLGNFAIRHEDWETAQTHYALALSLAERGGNRDALTVVLGNLGYVEMNLERPRAALALFERSMSFTAEDQVFVRSTNHSLMSDAYLQLKDWLPALEHARQGLEIALAVGLPEGIYDGLKQLGSLAEQAGDSRLAATLFAAADLRAPEDSSVLPQSQTRHSDSPREINADDEALDDLISLVQASVAQLRAAFTPLQMIELTPREQGILERLVQGESNREIGLALGISSLTVRNRLSELYAKLEVRSRTEAIQSAIHRGLVVLGRR
jgi:DNA-binding CsgD family transcriptional regulator